MPDKRTVGFFVLLRPHRVALAAGVGCLALLAATTAGYAYLTGPLLQVVLTGGAQGAAYLPVPRAWIAGEPGRVLLVVALLLGALALVKGLAHLGQALLLEGTAERIGHGLRVQVYDHLLHLPLGWHRRGRIGDLLARLIDDVQRVQEAAVSAPITLMREGLGALALLAVALYMSPRLTLAAALALPLAGLVIGLLSRGVKRAARGRQQRVGALADRAAVALGAIREVKSSGAEEREVQGLARHGRAALGWARRRILLRSVAPLANELMAALALGGTLVYAGGQIAAGHLAPERFISFFAALLMIYRPVKAVGQAIHVVASGAASVERVAGLLTRPREAGPERALPPLSHRVELRGVSFAYDESGAGVHNVDLALEVGQLVVLAGPSGAGKSTLASLVAGLERPSAGELLWDAERITGRPLADLRAGVALVPQQPLVLPASLAENLRYGAPHAADDQLRQVLADVGLDGLLGRLDRGLETVLGPEQGLGLSVGEAQRLAVARALLRQVHLLVLDEPSSALDPQSEQRLVQLLQLLRPRHALLVVAHSPALVAIADRVVSLEAGRVTRVQGRGGRDVANRGHSALTFGV